MPSKSNVDVPALIGAKTTPNGHLLMICPAPGQDWKPRNLGARLIPTQGQLGKGVPEAVPPAQNYRTAWHRPWGAVGPGEQGAVLGTDLFLGSAPPARYF